MKNKVFLPGLISLFVFAFLHTAGAYQDTDTGEFITKDPAGFVDGPNQYTYVRQNPWTKFDPEGLQEANPDFRLLGRIVAYTADTVANVVISIATSGNPTHADIMSPVNRIVHYQGGDEYSKKWSGELAGRAFDAAASTQVPEVAGQDGVTIESEPAPEKTGVKPYQVGQKCALDDNAFPKDGLQHDHQPSYASLIEQFRMKYHREPTDLEAAQIYEEGISMAIPDANHQKVSPTFGGRNTKELQKQDAQNPQAAATRDSQAQIDAADPQHKEAAQKGQEEVIKQNAPEQTQRQTEKNTQRSTAN